METCDETITEHRLIACSLLVLEMVLAFLIATQTLSQLLAGVSFSAGQIIGPIAGFSILGLVAIVVTAALLRGIQRRAEALPRYAQPIPQRPIAENQETRASHTGKIS